MNSACVVAINYSLISINGGGILCSTDVGNITLSCAAVHMLTSLRGWLCNIIATFTYHIFYASSYINKQLEKKTLMSQVNTMSTVYNYHGWIVHYFHENACTDTILQFRHNIIMIFASSKVFPTIYHCKLEQAHLSSFTWMTFIIEVHKLSFKHSIFMMLTDILLSEIIYNKTILCFLINITVLNKFNY